MKKYFSNIRTLAALLMAGAAFAACSNEENAIEQPVSPAGEQVYTFTIKATNDGASTRALSLDGTKLVASWTNGDELKVYNVTKNAALTGTLTASNASGATATFSGSLTGTIEKNDVLTLSYHQPAGFSDYAAQTGTLASAAGRDFATASVTVASVTSGNITTTADASFTTQTAVLKLHLSEEFLSEEINATSLTLSAKMDVPYVGEMTAEIATFDLSGDPYSEEDNGRGVLYFALPSASIVAEYLAGRLGNASLATTIAGLLPTATLSFTAYKGSYYYTKDKEGYPFEGGKYYTSELTMTKLKSLTVADQTTKSIGDQTFYYLAGETWVDALANHPIANAGWSISGIGLVYTSGDHGYTLCYDDGNMDRAVDPTLMIVTNKDYYLIWN